MKPKPKPKTAAVSQTRFLLKTDFRHGIVFLILLPFTFPGFLVTRNYVDLFEWIKVQQWAEVPATLTAIEKNSYDDGESVRAWLDGEFEYSVNEVEYTSSRILFNGSEGFPVSLRQTLRKLEPRVDQPDAISCYVNLREPSQAVLLRSSGWENYSIRAMASMIFASISFAALLIVILVWREARETVIRRDALPVEPWRWHRSWQHRSVTPETSKSFLLLGISFWWLVALIPSTIVCFVEVAKGNWFGLCVLIPFVFVFAFLCFSVHRFRISKLTAKGELLLSENHFQIGSTMNAECVLPIRLFPNGDVRTQLNCLDKEASQEELYTLIPAKACAVIGDKFRIPVSVTIPSGSPPSSLPENDGAIWKLNVKVPSDGGNYSVNFELPVFERGGPVATVPKPKLELQST